MIPDGRKAELCPHLGLVPNQAAYSVKFIPDWCVVLLRTGQSESPQSSPINYCLTSMLRAFAYHPLWETPGFVDIFSEHQAKERQQWLHFLVDLSSNSSSFIILQPNQVGLPIPNQEQVGETYWKSERLFLVPSEVRAQRTQNLRRWSWYIITSLKLPWDEACRPIKSAWPLMSVHCSNGQFYSKAVSQGF